MRARVLVIEDNRENLDLLVYLLESGGYAALTARDGVAGLGAAAREPPDLILCDIRMPVMDGFEVARRLKSDPALRAIPIVAVTASASGADRDEALAAGFDDFVTKPIDPETFLQQVRTMLGAHHAGQGSR